MGFLFTPLPLWVGIGGWIAAVALLALAIWNRPFVRLQDATLQHVWLALVTAITVLWASNAWLEDGIVMHLLGATLLVTLRKPAIGEHGPVPLRTQRHDRPYPLPTANAGTHDLPLAAEPPARFRRGR